MKTSARLLLLLTSSAVAQNFGSLAPAPADAPKEAAPAAAAEEAVATTGGESTVDPDLINTPSRYAGIDLDGYVRTLLASFDIRTRETDPFAFYQDPSKKPPEPTINKPSAPRFVPRKAIPFSEIIGRIDVRMVSPSKGQFMFHDRTFSVGDQIVLKTETASRLPVEVVRITAEAITFRNGTNGEVADLPTSAALPGGMSRGTKIVPAGMIPADEDIPIDLSENDAPRYSPRSISSKR